MGASFAFPAAAPGANVDITSLRGTTTNDSAGAGKIGEVIFSSVTAGNAISLTNNTPANITSISLTAGDWDVSLVSAWLLGASTTVTEILCSINNTTGTLDTSPGSFAANGYVSGTIIGTTPIPTLCVPTVRRSLAATTTVYGVAYALFGISTCSVYGILRARRMR